jgi:hypothetical protein
LSETPRTEQSVCLVSDSCILEFGRVCVCGGLRCKKDCQGCRTNRILPAFARIGYAAVLCILSPDFHLSTHVRLGGGRRDHHQSLAQYSNHTNRRDELVRCGGGSCWASHGGASTRGVKSACRAGVGAACGSSSGWRSTTCVFHSSTTLSRQWPCCTDVSGGGWRAWWSRMLMDWGTVLWLLMARCAFVVDADVGCSCCGARCWLCVARAGCL